MEIGKRKGGARPGAGRPKTGAGPVVRLKSEVGEVLKQICEERGQSLSEVVDLLIKERLSGTFVPEAKPATAADTAAPSKRGNGHSPEGIGPGKSPVSGGLPFETDFSRPKNGPITKGGLEKPQVDFADNLWKSWLAEAEKVKGEVDLDRLKLDYQLNARLLRINQFLEVFGERWLGAFGVKTGEHMVLLALRRAGPPYRLTPTDLFKGLMITSGTISKRLDRLETKGLVRRILDHTDRRSNIIELTPEGIELINKTMVNPPLVYKLFDETWTVPERELLNNLLRKFLYNREHHKRS